MKKALEVECLLFIILGAVGTIFTLYSLITPFIHGKMGNDSYLMFLLFTLAFCLFFMIGGWFLFSWLRKGTRWNLSKEEVEKEKKKYGLDK